MSGSASGRAELGRVLVVIPTYNEVATLEGTVDRLREHVPDADILIVDDASPDGTGEVADKLAAREPVLHVLHRPGKAGLGAAYMAGFSWGLDREYGVLVEMDADGSHHAEDLPRLIAALVDADLVLGSRWVRGGRVENWPVSREVLSRGANVYTRFALGVPLRDCTAGFRAFRRRTLQGVDLVSVASQGYCFQIDVTWRTIQAGFRVAEVPITFSERTRGASKMSRHIVAEALLRVTSWGLRRRWGQVRSGARLRTRTGRPAGSLERR